MTQSVDIVDVIQAALDARQAGVHVAMPARVTRYDSATQRVDAQPLVKQGYVSESGERVPERLPVVPGVPVAFPGSGKSRITWPVAVGDTVLLVFASCSLERWLAHGGEVDPVDDRRSALSDAVAFPTLHSFRSPPTTAPTDAMVMHADAIRLGGPGASDRVARESDLQQLAAALAAAIPTLAALNPQGAAALQALLDALPPGWPNCTSVVRAD